MDLPASYEYLGLSIVRPSTKSNRAVIQRYIESIRFKQQRSMQYNMRRVFRAQQKAILSIDGDDPIAYALALEESTPWMKEIYKRIYTESADAMYPLIQDGTLIKSFNRREKKDLTVETVYRSYIDDWLGRNGGAKITRINETTMQSIRDALVNADTTQEIYDALNNDFNDNISHRALRIATTETSTATNIGSLECVRAVATRESSKIWRTLNDAQVRDSHASMEGVSTNSLDAQFQVPGQWGYDLMECPGDPMGSAANVVNCRCWTQYEYL